MTSTTGPLVGSGHANDVILKRLGEVAVMGSRLLLIGREIAHDLDLGTEPRCIERLRDGEFTTPPWARTTSKDIAAWASASLRLEATRASILRGAGAAQFSRSRRDTIATESIDGTRFPADEEYLGRLVKKLARQLIAGVQLHEGLSYRDEHGEHWPVASIQGRTKDPRSSADNTSPSPTGGARGLSA